MRYLIPSVAVGCLLVTANAASVQAQATVTKTERTEAPTKVKKTIVEKKAAAQDVKQLELIEADLQAQLGSITLDNLLAQALKNNPDIRVAEAKMREAEAELNRVKLQVTQKVVAQRREIALLKTALSAAQTDFNRVQQLYNTGATPLGMLQGAEARLQKAKAELARMETELPYLVGTSPKGLGTSEKEYWKAINEAMSGQLQAQMEAEYFRIFDKQLIEARKEKKDQARNRKPIEKGAEQAVEFFPPALAVIVRESGRASLPAAMADKIRKALDTPVKVNFTQVGPKDILAYLQDQTNGFNLVDQAHIDKWAPIDLHLTEPVRVGAVFQLLEDQFGLQFVVREYGIVFTQAGRVPPGAVNLQTFWKERTPQALTSPPTKDKK